MDGESRGTDAETLLADDGSARNSEWRWKISQKSGNKRPPGAMQAPALPLEGVGLVWKEPVRKSYIHVLLNLIFCRCCDDTLS